MIIFKCGTIISIFMFIYLVWIFIYKFYFFQKVRANEPTIIWGEGGGINFLGHLWYIHWYLVFSMMKLKKNLKKNVLYLCDSFRTIHIH